MIVICNSGRDFSISRLHQGDAFIFGKNSMLVRADYILLTDSTGLFYVIKHSDIVWPETLEGATHVVKILAFTTIRRVEVKDACPAFDAKRSGTLAFRNLGFESRLKNLKFNVTDFAHGLSA